LKIKIFYDELAYRLKDSKICLKLIDKVIRSKKKLPGDLSFIITTDDKLIKINREFLDHDYYTDVIAFNNNEEKIVNGEVYISFDTVKKNAHNYNVSLRNEMVRVMVHGTLHLLGYKDLSNKEKEKMRKEEDKWLRGIN
jgi:probable rRNA maturation factor